MKDVLHHNVILDDDELECVTEDVLQMQTSQLEAFANDLLTIVKQRREKEQKQQIQKHLAALHDHINALQKMNYNVLFDTDDGTLRIWYDNKDFVASVEEAKTENKAW